MPRSGDSGWGTVNGRKLFSLSGLLRNSTKIAMQFLGLGQCSQNTPAKAEKLKRRPDGSRSPIRNPRSYQSTTT